MAALLKEIEGHHRELHESAVEIGAHFRHADEELPGILSLRMVDHLKWADAIRDAFLENKTSVEVQTDPTQCALGTWLSGEQAQKAYAGADAELKRAWDDMLIVHKRLHESAADNLAMRSAEAAKNTASMIEESVKNSKNGVDIATEVSKVLEEIVQSVGKTTDLVSEIAAASQEQAQGIDQVNTAIAQMDKVTQQNAANAEESASASEELSAQADSMNEIVGALVSLVGGSTAATQQVPSGRPERPAETSIQQALHGRTAAEPCFGHSDQTFHQIAGISRKD